MLSEARATLEKGLRVLAAEDHGDTATRLAWLLRISGHEVKVVYDGVQAITSALD
jgi:hypothetical protein